MSAHTTSTRAVTAATDDWAAFEQAAGAAVDRRQPADLADVLERVLDTGIVIAGEIRIDLLDIELLTIKLRLVVTSIDKAEEVGLDWWRGDPWYAARTQRSLTAESGGELRPAVPVVDVAEDDRYEVVPRDGDPARADAGAEEDR